MYRSPIDIITTPPTFDFDGEVFKAVQKVGINVDRDELLKALDYDREQYDKGYRNGLADAMNGSVYIVTQGEYSDYHIVKIFNSFKAAADYCANASPSEWDYSGYNIEVFNLASGDNEHIYTICPEGDEWEELKYYAVGLDLERRKKIIYDTIAKLKAELVELDGDV